MINKKIFTCSLLMIASFSCNKADDNTPTSCAFNTGNFNITINGADFDMAVNAETHFSILYNWSGDNASEFVLDSKDQNGNAMYLELGIPGQFSEGSTSYSSSTLDFDFFTIDVDTFNLYVSTITFSVSESKLDPADGVYKPVVATFTGTAHSFPWTNGQPPVNTMSISGSFCLNGIIMP